METSEKRAVVRLRVEGMRCHSCEQVLTAWLSDLRGIEAVIASHGNGQVVIYADEDVPVEAMLRAIVRAGFVPGAPTVLTGTDAIAAVEMPIAANKTDIGDVTLVTLPDVAPLEPASALPISAALVADEAARGLYARADVADSAENEV